MIPQIDTHLDRLFSGDVDEANANLLDSMIFSVYRVAVSDLSKQRDKHREVIDDLVARHTADEKDKRRARELAQEELNSLEKKYKEACDALDAQTNRKKKGGFKHEVE